MNKQNLECENIINDTATESAPKTCNVIGIYGLQNKVKPDKWYIGQSYNIIKRWVVDYKRLKCSRQPKIYNAIKKYGYDGFNKIILEVCPSDQSTINEREIFYIKFYDSIKKGYNLKEGGSHGTHTDETRKKLSISNTGKIHSEKTKEKIRIARAKQVISEETKIKFRKKRFNHSEETKIKMRKIRETRIYKPLSDSHKIRIGQGLLGHKCSEETKTKLRNSHKGKILSEEHKQKLRDAWKRRGPVSDETRLKLSMANKRRNLTKQLNAGSHVGVI